MGIIGKDFDYKLVKKFLTKEEVKLLNKYCEIRHRTNVLFFDPVNNDNSSQMISDKNHGIIVKFNEDSKLYEFKIDKYHADMNSSLESVMKQITDSYRSKPNKSQ